MSKETCCVDFVGLDLFTLVSTCISTTFSKHLNNFNEYLTPQSGFPIFNMSLIHQLLSPTVSLYALPVPPLDLVHQETTVLFAFALRLLRGHPVARSSNLSMHVTNSLYGKFPASHPSKLFPSVLLFCLGHLRWSPCSGK